MDYAQSYEDLEKLFLNELVKNRKFMAALAYMKPNRTTEEIFSYIWSLDEAHRFLTPALLPSSKSKDASCVYCRQGDIAHKLGNLDKALKLYNLAIVSAPHPAIMTGNSSFDKDNTRVLGNVYGDLAQAYMSRSVLLFDMEQYEKCFNDIDRALELDCLPPSQKVKILEIKEKCQKIFLEGKIKELSASEKALNTSQSSFAYVNPMPPKLTECNSAIPCVSSAVTLAYTPLQGRHLTANRGIVPGEIVCVDEGYSSVVFQEMSKMYCTVCVERCLVPLPCPTCSMVVFCSESCRTLGNHWQECRVLPTLYELGNKAFMCLPCRVMIKTSHIKIKKMIPLLQQEVKDQPPETLGFNKDGIYDSTDYRSVYHLVTNKEKRDETGYFKFSMRAFILTKLLQQGHYFLDDHGNPFTPSHEDIILTGSTLIHHLMNLQSNSAEINYWEENVLDHQKSSIEACGYAAYPLSLINHACNPNCVEFFYGKTKVVRATHFIPPGGSLTVSYGDSFLSADRDSRRDAIMKPFHFTCTCEACENDWPTFVNLPRFEMDLKCLMCKNEIHPIAKACSECRLDYNKPRAVKGMGRQDLPPYNYYNIEVKLGKLLSEFIAVTAKIAVGSTSDDDVKVVRKFIKAFCIYVCQPNFLLMNAVRFLCLICNRLGSRIYVSSQIPITS